MADKKIVYDIEGEEILTDALLDLVNQYPDLQSGEIRFTISSAEKGIGFFPLTGAVVLGERETITGHVTQNCSYPFAILYRAGGLSEARRKNVKEWLDKLGKWLEKQPITVGLDTHVLQEYPPLTGGRELTKITRTTPAVLSGTSSDNVEDWVININATYRNEFDR